MDEPQGGSPVGDRELIQQLTQSSRAAFDRAMTLHGPALYRYAWALADSRVEVEDHVQEVFLQLWRQRRHLDRTVATASLLPWLLTVCRNTVYNANRRARRARSEPLGMAGDPAAPHDPSVFDDLRFVRQEISRLNQVDQQLVQRCVVEGEPYDRVASDLGLTSATARKRVQRIRARLQTALIDHK